MRVFLTGGSGFVGQHLIRQLRAEGHTVLALARSTGSARAAADAGAQPVRGDLAQLSGRSDPAVRPTWLEHLREADAVIHAAARMAFWGTDAGFRADNHEPTVALHAAAVEAGVSRFVLVSAASVSTGSQRAAVVDENSDDGRPNIAYSRVKLATEHALRGSDSPGMTLIILRPPFIWGQGMTTLAEAVETARKGRFAWIDNGRHIMDFVHVENLADSVVLALSHGRHGVPYYVTDGSPMPIRGFFTALLASHGIDVSGSRSVPLAVASPMAAVMDSAARLLRRRTAPPLNNWLVSFMGRDRSYDISAARTDLRYEPRVSLDTGLLEMTR
ncbi:NAD(P)-dependent oxidoreductase [Streptomyces sp. NBC_00414]|uniref:NAD-dependent epimerase/dehydratase family protein n=1 Tax=Streptomyces sp. NBC_00414 TaxID=2975739 RepID=UPI002E206DDC